MSPTSLFFFLPLCVPLKVTQRQQGAWRQMDLMGQEAGKHLQEPLLAEEEASLPVKLPEKDFLKDFKSIEE